MVLALFRLARAAETGRGAPELRVRSAHSAAGVSLIRGISRCMSCTYIHLMQCDNLAPQMSYPVTGKAFLTPASRY